MTQSSDIGLNTNFEINLIKLPEPEEEEFRLDAFEKKWNEFCKYEYRYGIKYPFDSKDVNSTIDNGDEKVFTFLLDRNCKTTTFALDK